MLKKLLSMLMPAESDPQPDRVELATAVLLLDIAYADGELSAPEERLIRELLEQQFALDSETREELLELAEEAQRQSVDLHEFTSQINHNFSQQEKESIIEIFWRLTFADGQLDVHEEAMMRQLGSLIGLSHRQLIDAKLRVSKTLNSPVASE